MDDGTVKVWGANYANQLGQDDIEISITPIALEGLERVTAVAAGDTHSLALVEDGTVWAWGDNYSGQAGTGEAGNIVNYPTQVLGLANVRSIAAGTGTSYAVLDDGTVWAWGRNFHGELGDGRIGFRMTPYELTAMPQLLLPPSSVIDED